MSLRLLCKCFGLVFVVVLGFLAMPGLDAFSVFAYRIVLEIF